jgi:uncharacterized protein YqgC (DUF456 family)
MLHVAVAALAGICVLVGLVGSVAPVIPGPALICIGTLVYAWYTDFAVISGTVVGIQAGLALLSAALDYGASLVGAQRYGASRWGVYGAVAGGIAGLVAGGIAGMIIGPCVGAVLGELLYGRGLARSARVGMGTLIGFLGGTIGRLVIALIMSGLFVSAVLF